jgi:hypothetical protein
MIVKTGVSALSAPDTALSIFVCATENNNDVTKLPMIPETAIYLKSARFRRLMLAGRKGINTANAKTILKEATCSGENASSPFFISMNELPHIRVSISNNNHDSMRPYRLFVFALFINSFTK